MGHRTGPRVQRDPSTRPPHQLNLFTRTMMAGCTASRLLGASDAPGDHGALALGLREIYPRVPGAVICMTTAAYLHDLMPEQPLPLWFGIPMGVYLPKWDLHPLRVIRWTNDPAFSAGVEEIMFGGSTVIATSRERTIIDLIRYASRLGGYDAAARSLTNYRKGGGRQADLRAAAAAVSLPGPGQHTLDVLLCGLEVEP